MPEVCAVPEVCSVPGSATWYGWLIGGSHRDRGLAPRAPHTGGGHGFRMGSTGSLLGCESPRTPDYCRHLLQRSHLCG